MPAKYPGILIRLAEARFHYIAFQKVPYPYAIAKDGCGKNVQHKLLQTIEKKFFKNLVGEVGLAPDIQEKILEENLPDLLEKDLHLIATKFCWQIQRELWQKSLKLRF